MEVAKQVEDFSKKSPRQSRVDNLKQKLPFLESHNVNVKHSLDLTPDKIPRGNQLENMDLEGLTPTYSSVMVKKSNLNSTQSSFASKGL